jgi:hypothetical protein
MKDGLCLHCSSVTCVVSLFGASDGSDFLLELSLVGADQLVHLLPVLEEEERRGCPDAPRLA